MKRGIISLAIGMIVFGCFMGLNAKVAGAQSGEKITVEAEGSGETKMAALKDAWTVAVRQAVGMYTASRSEAKSDGLNDSFTEQIAAYSRGQVDSFELLSETHENDIWTVKIKANVDKDVLQETVAEATSKKVKLDGADLAAQAETAANKKKDAEDVLDTSKLLDFKNCLDYTPSVVSMKFEGKTLYFMQHVLKFNIEKFKKYSADLEKLVRQMSSKKFTLNLKHNPAKNAMTLLRAKDYPVVADPVFNTQYSHRKDEAKTMWQNDHYLVYLQKLAAAKGDGGPYIIINTDLNKNNPNWNAPINLREKSGQLLLFNFKDTNYTQQAYFSYDAGPIDNEPWCFISSASKATCYDVNETLREYKLPTLQTVTFSVSVPDLPALEDDDVSLTIGLPPIYNTAGKYGSNRERNYMISPQFLVSYRKDVNELTGYDCDLTPVLIVWQRLDINAEEMASLKEMTGKYELSPSDRTFKLSN